MSWDHDRVEELLAGRALGALDPEETALAERAVIEHVRGCGSCRSAMDAFRLVAGDLALLAPGAAPPRSLAAAIRRLTAPRRLRPGLAAAAVAAALLSLAGMGAWNALLAGRLDRTESRQALMLDAVSALGHPESAAVPLVGAGGVRVALVYVPGGRRTYLIASRLPEPPQAYQVWFVGPRGAWSPGTFVPQEGGAVLAVRTDAGKWETVMITEAPDEGAPAPRVSPLVSGKV